MGKKAGRPDQFARFPELADRVTPACSSTTACGSSASWFLVVVIGALVLLVQKIDSYTHGTTGAAVADTDDSHNVPPPRPNYGPWLPLGATAAALAVFVGGWLARHAIRLLSPPGPATAPAS